MSIFRILHFTDFHYPQLIEPHNQIRRNILTYIQDLGKCDVLICTGDITDQGNMGGLKEGMKFLMEITEKIGHPCLLITPGNHDTIWLRNISLDDIEGNKIEKRYCDFITIYEEVTNYKDHPERKVIRPVLIEDDWKKPYVTHALSMYIQNHCDLTKITTNNRRNLPFYWDTSANVFIYMLSSVDLSGGLYIPLNDVKKVREILKTDNRDDIQKYLMDKAFVRDIPLINSDQILTLETIDNTLKNNPDTSEKYLTAIKIAALHHPLTLNDSDHNIREFDHVVNGQRMMNILTDRNFSLILFGHKHSNEVSINFGQWVRGDTFQSRQTNELVLISGGKVHSNDVPIHRCQIIEIFQNTNLPGKDVKVQSLTMNPGEKLSEPQTIFTADNTGSIKWLNHNGYSTLCRSQKLNERFNSLICSVEKEFYSGQHIYVTDYNNDCEKFINTFFSFMKEYSSGEYGIDENWVKEIERDFYNEKALYFIDIPGSSSWMHPIFVKHLCNQLFIYTYRNFELLHGEKQQWCHTEPVERALQRFGRQPSRKLVKLDEGKNKIIERYDIKELELDICRILIWEREKLFSAPGRFVTTFHKIFKVPLFFLDRKIIEKTELKQAVQDDYHIIINKNNQPIRGIYHRKGENVRREMNRDSVKGFYENYCTFLAHSNLEPIE